MSFINGYLFQAAGCECASLKPCCNGLVRIFDAEPSVSADGRVVTGGHIAMAVSNSVGYWSASLEQDLAEVWIASRCSQKCPWEVEHRPMGGGAPALIDAYVNVVGPAETAEGQAGNYTFALVDSMGAPLVADVDIVVSIEAAGTTDGADTAEAAPTTVTIPAGESQFVLTQQFLMDTSVDPDELHVVRITGASPAKSGAYRIRPGWLDTAQTVVREDLIKTCFTSVLAGALSLTVDTLPGTQPPFWVDETGATTAGESFSKVYPDDAEKTVCVWHSPDALVSIEAANQGLVSIDINTERNGALIRINAPGNPGLVVDADEIASLTTLQHLNLDGSALSGPGDAFAALTQLILLHLGNTDLSGPIDWVSDLQNLSYLHVGNTSVTGSLSTLSTITSLQDLFFFGTGLTGTTADLSGLTELVRLYGYSSPLTGDVAGLAPLVKLEHLLLGGTSVDGDPGDLAVLSALVTLHLYSTGIAGSIDPLAAIATLDRLRVENTVATGTASMFSGLTQFDYQNSGVS